MGFFDKLKESASKAADKAKDSVEVVRLNSQISAKRKEIEKLFMLIGENVFRAHQDNHLSGIQGLVQESSDSIIALQAEIEQLEAKIKIIKDEKDCVCGQVLPLEAKFCSTCGHKFEDASIVVVEEVVENPILIGNAAESGAGQAAIESLNVCTNCQNAIGADDKFCENCGSAVTD